MSGLSNFRPLLNRDDRLGITSSSSRQTGKLREAIIKVFKDHGLSISIDTGLTKVNFLDVTLDLGEKMSSNHTESLGIIHYM